MTTCDTANATELDLSPASATFRVIEGEPTTLRCPMFDADGAGVDVAADYPGLVTRTKINDAAVVEASPTIEDTNVIIIVLPELARGDEAYWELRDNDADHTWVVAAFVIERDYVPQ